MTRLLVLGGSAFVGRALVEEGLARGWEVATFNRGASPAAPDPRIERLHGDRTDPASLAPIGGRDWDLVADTWSGPPAAARDGAAVLDGHVGHYVYISSGSVYEPTPEVGADESWPTTDGSPDDEAADDYARCKRGAELAIARAFGERALLARAGTILGPHEDVGRLPWWLSRMARGGEVLAPGPPARPLALIDARDLARFVLDAALAGLGGPCNVVSRRGHATMESLLTACLACAGRGGDRLTRLTWVTPEAVAAAGIEPWTELPIWLAPGTEFEGMHGAGVERAHAAGLRCRPVAETVADTWAWMESLNGPPPRRSDVPVPGLDPATERAALAAAHH